MAFFAQALPQLACLAMMLLALAPQNSEFWECEGRPCGSTAWTCCCQAEMDSHDSFCASSPVTAHLETPSHSQEIGECPAQCHCSKVTQTTSPSFLTATADFHPLPVIALVIRPFGLKPEHAVETEVVTGIESRGPPPSEFRLACPTLRGPPLG